MKKTFQIALSGGIGSGKSLVGSFFRSCKIDVVDADEIGHEITSPGSPILKEIARFFGANVIQDNGQLNRALLRSIVFSDNEKKRKLENILHPPIHEAMQAELKKAVSPYCIAIIPLLLETSQHQNFDRVLIVDAPKYRRLAWVAKRSGMSLKEIESVMRSQADSSSLLEIADDVIHNVDNIDALEKKVIKLHQQYLLLAERP